MTGFLYKSFPFYLNEDRKNTLLIFFTSAFVFLFLLLYVPFGDPMHSPLKSLWWGVCCFSVLYLKIILLPKFFPRLFDLTEWTVIKYILFNAWLLVFMSLVFSIFNFLFYCSMSYPYVLLKTFKEVSLTGLIPLVAVTVFAKNELLRQNLADAVKANKKLHEIQVIRETAVLPDNTITLSTDTSETFTVKLTDLIYVAALDNYSEVYWENNGSIVKKLLRVTLKNIELQLKNQFLIRCHRSYLVNIREIESISGNTNGYKLQMKRVDMAIPVSRAKGKEIIAHIQQIRDLMELL